MTSMLDDGLGLGATHENTTMSRFSPLPPPPAAPPAASFVLLRIRLGAISIMTGAWRLPTYND